MDRRAAELKEQYRLRFAELGDYRRKVWEIICDNFLARQVHPHSTILDLGCGWGEFINNITARRKLAMDLNPDTKAKLADDVEFIHQDCSREWRIGDRVLDVVFTSNFLEHLPDKPSIERTVQEARRCLKQNGTIICLGPNIKFIPGAYWDFWDHHVPLSESSLSELLRLNGFSIDLCIPRFLPYSMSSGRKSPLFLVKLYLRIPWLWPLVGKQFLIIGRKVGEGPEA